MQITCSQLSKNKIIKYQNKIIFKQMIWYEDVESQVKLNIFMFNVDLVKSSSLSFIEEKFEFKFEFNLNISLNEFT